MVFPGLDPAAIARALVQVAGEEEESAEVYFERRLDAELPPAGAPAGLRVRREEGLAVRMTRAGRGWIASRDGLDGRALVEALRQVARVGPAASAEPELAVGPSPVEAPCAELLAFPGRLERELRRKLAAFPLRLTVRSHRRDLLVVGPRVVAPAEREAFFSLDAELPWGSCGELSTTLGDEEAATFAARLVLRFRAREASPPPAGRMPLVFAPAAAAVALHEAVAHALEADLLARSGRPDAGLGVELAPAAVSVLDDPATAPAGVERTTDDEGVPVLRRWLLREGRVEQPIADAVAARRWPQLLPGSGFRSGRHGRPRPRTYHLELLAGSATEADLAAAGEGGLWIPEVASGALDPASGRFVLDVPAARRIRGGAAADPVGRFRVEGRLAELLAGVVAVGAACEPAGAGWCAKGGERRPVWARSPSLAVAGLEVRS